MSQNKRSLSIYKVLVTSNCRRTQQGITDGASANSSSLCDIKNESLLEFISLCSS